MSTLLPEHLRAFRAITELSRDDLSIKSGVSRNTIARFEQGESITLKSIILLENTLLKYDFKLFHPNQDGYIGIKLKLK